jgi:hypothetical protein
MSGELFPAGVVSLKHDKHDCEVHLLPVIKAEIERLWDRAVVYLDQSRKCEVEAKATLAGMEHRGVDPDLPPPSLTVADLEKFIHRIARDHEPGIQINNRGRSGGPPKWLNKLILGVGVLLIAGAITTTATTIVLVGSMVTKLDAYITSNDRRVDRVEKQTDENTRRLDRGALVEP